MLPEASTIDHGMVGSGLGSGLEIESKLKMPKTTGAAGEVEKTRDLGNEGARYSGEGSSGSPGGVRANPSESTNRPDHDPVVPSMSIETGMDLLRRGNVLCAPVSGDKWLELDEVAARTGSTPWMSDLA